MPQIGSQHFCSIGSDVAKQYGSVGVEITRAFVNGHAFLDAGKKAIPIQFPTLSFVTSQANANTLHLAFDAMRLTIVSITHKGITIPNMLILAVGDYLTEQVATSVGMVNNTTGAVIAAGTAGYTVKASWVVQYVGT